jgi:hypothetical protein
VQNHLAGLCQNESRHQLGSVAYSVYQAELFGQNLVQLIGQMFD